MSSITDNKYVVFKLDSEYYGIPIEKVISIEKMEEATRIPNAPRYVYGVVNLRGEVISLIDLRKKINLESKGINSNSRIIIISEGEITAGLIVDSSSEVIEIQKENIDNPPSSTENGKLDYIYGVGRVDEKLVILLDLLKVLEH